MIFLNLWKPDGNVSPSEAFITGGNNVGWSGGSAYQALDTEGGNALSRSFNGSSEEEDYAGFQVTMDHSLVEGYSLVLWLKARQTGSGLSMPSPAFKVINSDGVAGHLQPSFWGAGTGRTLSGTYDWYSASIELLSGSSDGPWTENSVGLWVFPPIDPYTGLFAASKTLELDAFGIERVIE